MRDLMFLCDELCIDTEHPEVLPFFSLSSVPIGQFLTVVGHLGISGNAGPLFPRNVRFSFV